MSLNLILHPTTNLYSYSIRTLVDVLAQILDSSQSSRDLNINVVIKKKKKLRTVRDYILIGEFGPIMFNNQAIVRSSIKQITVLSLICFLFILLRKSFTILFIDHILSLEIVNTT